MLDAVPLGRAVNVYVSIPAMLVALAVTTASTESPVVVLESEEGGDGPAPPAVSVISAATWNSSEQVLVTTPLTSAP